MAAERLAIASYNIHGCVGVDRRRDPRRIAEVIGELDCDMVALQEVASTPGGHDSMQLEFLAHATGMHAVHGPTMTGPDGQFGNGLLTRFPVTACRHHDFSFRRREPRGAIDVDVDAGSTSLRLIATHLGLRPLERRHQVQQLLALLKDADPHQLVVVIGDMNEWLPTGRPLRWMHGHMGRPPLRRTWPVWLPLLALDRIWVRPADALKDLVIHQSRRAKVASDHYPLKAVVEPSAQSSAGAGNLKAIKVPNL